MKTTPISALFFSMMIFVFSSFAHSAEEVVVYNWTEYISDAVLERFTQETGIRVKYATYESNEAMYAKVKLLKARGYDIIFPSTYFVNKMRVEDLLHPLDHKALPNLKHLDPTLLNKPYDEGNHYSMPYMWGGTGIIVNTTHIDPSRVNSWADLWHPAFKGKVLLQDDLREVFGMALLIQGYSINDTNPTHIREAYELLKGILPNVRLFNSDNPKMPYLNEEVSIGMIWNGEAYRAAAENPKLTFIWPKEGGIFWTDCMCIPRNARNIRNAHKFINFLMRPDNAAEIAEEIGYASPNQAALDMLPESLKTNPTAYPPAEVIERSEFQNDIGDAVFVYEKHWEMLKSGR